MPYREKVIKGIQECDLNGGLIGNCPYKGILVLLKEQEQEPVVPIRRSAHAQGTDDVWYECGKCGEFLGVNPCSKQFCANCGREVKWE